MYMYLLKIRLQSPITNLKVPYLPKPIFIFLFFSDVQFNIFELRILNTRLAKSVCTASIACKNWKFENYMLYLVKNKL